MRPALQVAGISGYSRLRAALVRGGRAIDSRAFEQPTYARSGEEQHNDQQGDGNETPEADRAPEHDRDQLENYEILWRYVTMAKMYATLRMPTHQAGTSTPATAQGGKNVRPPTDTTKSRAGKRIVPLPGAIVDLLLAHKESQSMEQQRAGQLWSEEGWIFTDETGRAVNPVGVSPGEPRITSRKQEVQDVVASPDRCQPTCAFVHG